MRTTSALIYASAAVVLAVPFKPITFESVPVQVLTIDCPKQICVDAVNACGRSYGGCYDTCKYKFEELYTVPLCPNGTVPTLDDPPVSSGTPLIIPTPTPSPTPSPSPSPDVCPSICKDYVEPCSQRWYGGCYNSCLPEPIWEKPVCENDTAEAV